MTHAFLSNRCCPNFASPHYGTEFRIELVDATTNNPVGSGFCTTQSLLQRQRDDFVERKGLPLLAPFRGPPNLDFHVLTLDLRSGVKTTSEFYAPSKTQSSAFEDKALTGKITLGEGFCRGCGPRFLLM